MLLLLLLLDSRAGLDLLLLALVLVRNKPSEPPHPYLNPDLLLATDTPHTC